MLKPLAIALLLGAGSANAGEIWGLIEGVDSGGVVSIKGQVKVLLWGLEEENVARQADFLKGRWIRCNVLAFDGYTYLGDCGLSLDFDPPMNSAEYLHLATWLPAFDMAIPSCSVGDFGDKFTFFRPGLRELYYGCQNGVPSTYVLFDGPANELH